MEESGGTGARGLFYVDFKWVCFGNLIRCVKRQERENVQGGKQTKDKKEREEMCVCLCVRMSISN